MSFTIGTIKMVYVGHSSSFKHSFNLIHMSNKSSSTAAYRGGPKGLVQPWSESGSLRSSSFGGYRGIWRTRHDQLLTACWSIMSSKESIRGSWKDDVRGVA